MRALVGPDTATLSERYAAPRPSWLRLNFVATVDGAVQGNDGRSGDINNEVDKLVFDTLRELADAIVVGAGTARTEGYRPTHTPIVVVTRGGKVPPLLAHGPPGAVLMVTCAESPGLAEARRVLVDEHVLVLGDREVDLAALPSALGELGFTGLLCEGGPSLARDLLAADVVDELCLTTVPRLLAGDEVRLLTGPSLDVPLRLVSLLEQGGTLLARWWVDRPSAPGG